MDFEQAIHWDFEGQIGIGFPPGWRVRDKVRGPKVRPKGSRTRDENVSYINEQVIRASFIEQVKKI